MDIQRYLEEKIEECYERKEKIVSEWESSGGPTEIPLPKDAEVIKSMRALKPETLLDLYEVYLEMQNLLNFYSSVYEAGRYAVRTAEVQRALPLGRESILNGLESWLSNFGKSK